MQVRTFFIVALMILLATACQPANKPPANQSSPPSGVNQEERVQQMAYEKKGVHRADEDPQAVAKRLVDLALKDPNVHDATAVVLGRYAVVGIDVTNTLDSSRVGTIKYSVAQALKEDPKGANALVTADPDLYQRLREMANELRNGRPVAGIMQELSEIIARIVPQFPKQVERREQPQTPDNEKRMNQQSH
jgi:YhcN/YlaJ family sporulation lipoprotein